MLRPRIEPARSAIEVNEVRFSGSLRYTDKGHIYVDYPPNEPKYFGEPSPEIDKAWQDLIGRTWRHDTLAGFPG
jgi:hypothetical protein